jgi:hypothetical protein
MSITVHYTRRQKTWALKNELLHLSLWVNTPGRKFFVFPPTNRCCEHKLTFLYEKFLTQAHIYANEFHCLLTLTSRQKKHEPSKLNYNTFRDELALLGVCFLFCIPPIADGCCVRKMSVLYKKLSTQTHNYSNEFSRTPEKWKYRSSEAVSLHTHEAGWGQPEGRVDHHTYVLIYVG